MSQPRKLTPRDLLWVQQQLANPSPVYLVSELALLAGPSMQTRRLRRWLVSKGILKRSAGQRRNHLIPLARLMAMWPEFWLSVRRAWSEAGLGKRREEDDDESA